MNVNDIAVAHALLNECSLSIRDIAKRMNVSVATLYRHTSVSLPSGANGPLTFLLPTKQRSVSVSWGRLVFDVTAAMLGPFVLGCRGVG